MFGADKMQAEMVRQGEIAAAHAASLTAAGLVAAVASAHRSYFSKLIASGLANGVPTNGAREFLRSNPTPLERISRTDNTAFALLGGRYLVTVAGTFAEGASVELRNAAGDVLATFADVGSATVDLCWGNFAFALTGVTNFAGTVLTAPYA